MDQESVSNGTFRIIAETSLIESPIDAGRSVLAESGRLILSAFPFIVAPTRRLSSSRPPPPLSPLHALITAS